MNILENDMVRLRAVEPSDADVLYRWENDTDVWREGEMCQPVSFDALVAMAMNQQGDVLHTGQLRFMICDRVDNRCVGTIDLFDYDARNLRAAVGIMIYEQSDRRRGYARAALGAVSGYARKVLLLNQLHCDIHADNVASLALFEGAGFSRCGVRRAWTRTEQGWRDTVFLQLLF